MEEEKEDGGEEEMESREKIRCSEMGLKKMKFS